MKMGVIALFCLISITAPNPVSLLNNSGEPYLRGLWTRAKDATPSKISNDLLVAEWDKIEDTIRSLIYSVAEEAVKRSGEHFMNSNISMPSISKKCSKNLFDVFLGIVRLEPWAHLMLSSSLPPTNSIGKTMFLGSFDTCIDIQRKNRFQGKYCKLELTFPFPNTGAYIARHTHDPVLLNFTSPDSLANFLIKPVAPYFYLAYIVSAVCLPSTCSVDDIKAMTDKLLEIVDVNFHIRVIGCQLKEPLELNAYDVIAICILLFAFSMCFSGTVVDHYLKRRKTFNEHDRKPGWLPRVVACFSIRQGTAYLVREEKSPISRVFGGIQVLTILWLIVFYSLWYMPLNVFGNLNALREPVIPFTFELIRNGFLALETLLFVWATLLMERQMKETENTGLIKSIFKKIMSVVPAIVLIIAFAIISKNLNNGPIWKETVVSLISRRCEKNWWQNLFFINNYVSCSDQCLVWLWLMAADMQLHIAALLVIAVIKKKPKIGMFIIWILFATGIVACILNHVIYNLPPTVILSATYLPDDLMYYLDNGLFPSYVHLTTYSIGLAVGYVIHKKPELKISGRLNTIVYLFLVPLGFVVVCSVHPWNIGAPPPSLPVSTLYSISAKVVWSLSLAWVTVSCVKRSAGAISCFLSWKMFTILGRLTYTVYLVHPLLIYLYVGSIRQVIPADGRTLMCLYIAIVVVSYVAAYVLYILAQSPFLVLEQLFCDSPEETENTDSPIIKNGKEILPINNLTKC